MRQSARPAQLWRNFLYNNLRRFLGLVFAIIVFYFGLKTEKVLYWAIVLIFMGEFIRVWSAGYIKKNKVLSVVGPYRYVRNPLYVGSFLIGCGFGLFINNPIILVLLVAFFLYIYTLKINSEEIKLADIFGDKYLDYKKNVRRWLPGFTPYGDEQAHFDIKLAIFKNKEYNAILGCLAMIFLILIFKKHSL